MKLILSLALFVLATGAFIIRLEIMGRTTLKHPARLRMIHKTLGYLAVGLIFVVSYSCLKLLGGRILDSSPRVVWHILFSSFILPVLSIKLLIIRRYKQMMSYIFLFGLSLYLLLFGCTLTSTNYAFLGSSRVEADGQDARTLLETKCTRCHSLNRIRNGQKSPEEWATTVNRMKKKLPGWISEEEAHRILDFLQNRHQELQE
jgi:phage FluMu protein Com